MFALGTEVLLLLFFCLLLLLLLLLFGLNENPSTWETLLMPNAHARAEFSCKPVLADAPFHICLPMDNNNTRTRLGQMARPSLCSRSPSALIYFTVRVHACLLSLSLYACACACACVCVCVCLCLSLSLSLSLSRGGFPSQLSLESAEEDTWKGLVGCPFVTGSDTWKPLVGPFLPMDRLLVNACVSDREKADEEEEERHRKKREANANAKSKKQKQPWPHGLSSSTFFFCFKNSPLFLQPHPSLTYHFFFFFFFFFFFIIIIIIIIPQKP